MMNAASLNWFSELTQLHVKKCFLDLMCVQLIKGIDNIENKILPSKDSKDEELIAWKSFILSHEEVRKRIGKLRKNKFKLSTINEIEEFDEEEEEELEEEENQELI
uniref:Uncharacterized protein n=1 Tax=Glossina pallidipes TaxID=7398 RepID=A0A1B0A1P2_GLOPL